MRKYYYIRSKIWRKKKSKPLPSVFTFNTRQRGRPLQFRRRHGMEDGRYSSLPSVFIIFCRAHFFVECFSVSLPSILFCRVFFYFFTECIYLSSVFFLDTRQRSSLPSARKKILGKATDTWQSSFFP